jgi:hypothetical protein
MSGDVCAMPTVFKNPDYDEQKNREALVQALMSERRSSAISWTLAETVEGLVLEAKARGRLLRFPTLRNRTLVNPFREVAS